MKTIDIYVIEPKFQTIQPMKMPATYEAARTIIENIIEAVAIGPNLTLWIDEEGLLDRHDHGFFLGDIPQPFMGTAFIAGDHNGDFDSVPAWLTLEKVKSRIHWYEGPSPEPRFEVTSFETVDELLDTANKMRSQE